MLIPAIIAVTKQEKKVLVIYSSFLLKSITMLCAQSHHSLNISEGRQIIAFSFCSSLSCFPSHWTPNNICCSLKKVQSTDPIKLNDPFVHCLWIKPNAPERLKQAVDKLVTHADIIDNIHQLNGCSSELL